MACTLTAGRLEPCKDSVGGINAIYFANYKIYAELDADDQVTDLSTDNDFVTPTAVTLYKWDLRGGTNLEQTITSSRDNGTTYFNQVLTAVFKKLDYATQKQIKLMAFGRPQVIVADNNGNAFLCGVEHGMDVTGGTIATGTAMGDLSGYTLTLTGMEALPAAHLSGATLADPFAGLTTEPTIVVGT